MLSKFKNESGSTTLTVVLSIAVAICLLSASLQWYWANSSAADIQLAADLGALSYLDIVSRTTLVIQIIDTTILTANLMGLVLHGLVVVSGIAAAAQAPLGGGIGASLLSKIIEVDKNYVQRRKQFVNYLYSAAQALNSITPFIAFGYARNLIDENNALRTNFNNAQYGVIPLAMPAVGTVERSSGFSQEGEVLDAVTIAHNKNEAQAQKIKDLEEKLEAVKRQCFDLDIYKQVARYTTSWRVEEVAKDFKQELSRIRTAMTDATNTLDPIDASSLPAKKRLDDAFKRDEESVAQKVMQNMTDAFGTGAPGDTSQVMPDTIFGEFERQSVHLVEHVQGERKAYHRDPACSGLYNAQNPVRETTLASVITDADHPPCSLCLPLNWQAVQDWRSPMAPLMDAWNKEVVALQEYAQLNDKLEAEKSKLQSDSADAFNELLAHAREILAADRIRYLPPGRRGVICLAYSTGKQTPPPFALATLTHTTNEKPDTQIALAGARLKPTVNAGHIRDIIRGQRSFYNASNTSFGTGVFRFLDQNAGLYSQLSALWISVTEFFISGSQATDTVFDRLPWGVGEIAGQFMRRVTAMAGVSKPDLNYYRPFLVNTAQVGSLDGGGAESALVSQIQSAKKLFNSGARISESSLGSAIRATFASLEGFTFSTVYSKMHYTVFDGYFKAPFRRSLVLLAESTLTRAKQNIQELGW